jgi:hypothetical protein
MAHLANVGRCMRSAHDFRNYGISWTDSSWTDNSWNDTSWNFKKRCSRRPTARGPSPRGPPTSWTTPSRRPTSRRPPISWNLAISARRERAGPCRAARLKIVQENGGAARSRSLAERVFGLSLRAASPAFKLCRETATPHGERDQKCARLAC